MARWRALPAGIDPAVAALVAHPCKAKDFSGLSVKELASATGYSTSSWERCLSGRALPPPAAVRSLAKLVGADPVQLLTRLDAAVNARRSGPSEPASPSESEPAQPTQPTQTIAVHSTRELDAFVDTPLLGLHRGGTPLTACLSESSHTAATCYRLTAHWRPGGPRSRRRLAFPPGRWHARVGELDDMEMVDHGGGLRGTWTRRVPSASRSPRRTTGTLRPGPSHSTRHRV
ncbi:helix-turn-helix domain-containing protein [Streptomyces sp. NBC_00986]|uniref:helix-turn-helix domain-containing protein n=1 Tax=Streptomyces sp. NBC_00986 TaxID=2903702 RepID=UPI003864FF68|nr:helix-turn-helix domain-containing protein [Streptomyces sp. NBC_00986]